MLNIFISFLFKTIVCFLGEESKKNITLDFATHFLGDLKN